MSKRILKQRLKKALEKLAASRLEVHNARCRRDYWYRIVQATRYRLGLVGEGQIEMEIEDREVRA